MIPTELMAKSKKADAIIACGGRSTRMGIGNNKLLADISGSACIYRSCQPFTEVDDVQRIIVTAPHDLHDAYKSVLSELLNIKTFVFVDSGDTRQQSVANAVNASSSDIIVVHDGARPIITAQEIESSIDDAYSFGSSIVCTPMTETIRFYDGESSYCPDRSNLYSIKTPQSFSRRLYIYAMEKSCGDYTDDAQLLDAVGFTPHLTIGSRNNIKLTVSEDLKMVRGIFDGNVSIRIGHGYDVHRLVPDRKFILGGVEIPYSLGLSGHSDADVLTHALIDSLLGAAALGDIGKLFPDSAEEYKGADSVGLLKRVCTLLRTNGFEIVNSDVTVIAQAPKLAPHIQKMRERLSEAMEIDISNLSIKATTEEGLGFTGSGEGIACHAVSLVTKA